MRLRLQTYYVQLSFEAASAQKTAVMLTKSMTTKAVTLNLRYTESNCIRTTHLQHGHVRLDSAVVTHKMPFMILEDRYRCSVISGRLLAIIS